MSIRLIIVGLMLATAAALGMIAFQLAAPQTASHAAATASTPVPLQVSFLVTSHALPAGTLARDEDFAVKTASSGQVPEHVLPDSPDSRVTLRGAMMRRYLDAGAPIRAEDVLRPRDRGFLASVLQQGMRAVSIGVDPVTGVAGLIWPGDRVDVILTQVLDASLAPVARRVLSETVLTDIRVIAVDQEIVQGAPAAAASVGHNTRTVTLEVTQDQAERLAVAERIGHLALAIRAAETAPTTATQRPTVFGGDVSPALSRSEEPVGMRVQVIQGDQRTEVKFR